MPKNDNFERDGPLKNFAVGGGFDEVQSPKADGISARGEFPRITRNRKVMGGKPCIRGMRMTVGMIVGQMSGGATVEEMLDEYPLLEKEDIYEAMGYAAWIASHLEYDILPAA